MKDEKKIKATEEAKKEAQLEENGTKLTDKQMAQVTGGNCMQLDRFNIPAVKKDVLS